MEHLKITEEEYDAIRTKMQETDRKCAKRRLEVLMLTYQGMEIIQIAKIMNISPSGVSQIRRRYRRQGLEEFSRKKPHPPSTRLLTFEQEEEILSRFSHRTMVKAKEVKAALDEASGKDSDVTNVYNVMRRHGWRRVKLNGEDAEACKGSKKDPARYWTPKPEAEQATQDENGR